MATVGYETVSGIHPVSLRPLSAEPLVSVLVSNYNYGRYIGSAIESALDQTYRNLELIICDDGSTDNSVEIIEAYERKDPRVLLIRKANGGQASGFNAAFSVSQGEIIALLDSDDLFLPNKVERIVADFQAHPDSGFGVHRVIRVSADLRRQGVWPMSAPLPAGWYGTRMLQDGGIFARSGSFTAGTGGDANAGPGGRGGNIVALTTQDADFGDISTNNPGTVLTVHSGDGGEEIRCARQNLDNHQERAAMDGALQRQRGGRVVQNHVGCGSVKRIATRCIGAGEGNRTLVVSLGSFCSAIELHPRGARSSGGPRAPQGPRAQPPLP